MSRTNSTPIPSVTNQYEALLSNQYMAAQIGANRRAVYYTQQRCIARSAPEVITYFMSNDLTEQLYARSFETNNPELIVYFQGDKFKTETMLRIFAESKYVVSTEIKGKTYLIGKGLIMLKDGRDFIPLVTVTCPQKQKEFIYDDFKLNIIKDIAKYKEIAPLMKLIMEGVNEAVDIVYTLDPGKNCLAAFKLPAFKTLSQRQKYFEGLVKEHAPKAFSTMTEG